MRSAEIMVVPSWIGGRAYLSQGKGWIDVVAPSDGRVLRRLPRAGDAEWAAAQQAAIAGQPEWRQRGAAGRQAALATLADALAGYGEHFAALLAAERGLQEDVARQAIADGVASLRNVEAGDAASVAVTLTARGDFAALLAELATPLLAGACVVLSADAATLPGTLFALCELTARAGWPPGAVNLIYVPAGELPPEKGEVA